MELEEFAELASGTPLSEREKTLLADMKTLSDLHKFDIETRVMGKRPDLMVFDDVYDEIAEKYGRIGGRGSAKSMIRAEYLYKMAFPPRVGADQVKGPKGPRGKWGKLT